MKNRLCCTCYFHESRNSDVHSIIIGILLALDEVTKVTILGHMIALEDVDKKRSSVGSPQASRAMT
jgi:hypothetical protein